MSEDAATEALLAPFAKTWEAARKYEGIAATLGRASFQVEGANDRKTLRELSDRYFEYAKALRDSIPIPTETVADSVDQRLL